MYKVKLRVSGMVWGEWSSDSISEMLGDYLVISQIWFESDPWGVFPSVTMEEPT